MEILHMRSRPPNLQTIVAALLGLALAPSLATSRPLQVVDRAGRPIEGALVGTSPFDATRAAATDAGGHVVAPEGPVSVEAAGFLGLEGTTEPRVVLTRPSRVVVRAVEASTGAPIASGRVRLWPHEDGEPSGDLAPVAPAEAALAESSMKGGRASFDRLSAGTYRVLVEAPGFLSVSRAVAPGPEAEDDVLLRLVEASVVEGLVLAEGKPVEGAVIRLLPGLPAELLRGARAGRGLQQVSGTATSTDLVTDAKGRFRHDQIPAERRVPFGVIARAPDLRWGLALVAATGLSGNQPPEERTVSVTIEVAGGLDVAGLAVWSDGDPAIGVPVVAELEVELRGFGGSRPVGISLTPVFEDWGGGPETVSGPDGEFRLRALPRADWRLIARPLEHAASEPVLVELGDAAEAPAPVRVEIARGLVLEGLVVDASGAPVSGARVTGEQREGEQRDGRQREGRQRLFRDLLETSTDAKGRFTLSGLEPGELILRVEATGHGSRSVEIGRAEEAGPQRIVLQRTGSLYGLVANAMTGEPLTRFSVLAVRAEDDPGSSRNRFFGGNAGTEIVSESGRFELEEIDEGRWAALVRAEGYLTRVGEPVDLRAGEASDAGLIELMPGATLVGRVEDADSGVPIEGALVTLEGMGGLGGRPMFGRAGRGRTGESPTDTSDSEGLFRLDGLPPGEFTVTASHHLYPARGAHSRRVSVGEDPSVAMPPFVLEMEGGGTVAGRVLDSSGQAVPGAVVVAVDPRTRGRGSLVGGPVDADAEGRFVLEALPVGELTVRRSDRMEGGAQVLVRKGEVVEVVLRDEGVRVFGSVLVSGRPVEARVRLLAASWGAPRSNEWSPTYELAGVPPGEWTLRVDVRDPDDPLAPTREERIPLTVPEDVVELQHDIRLEAEDTGDDVLVEGRVVDAETGQGLHGWLVSARLQGASTETARTDEGGRFALTLTESGAWRIATMGVGEDALDYDPPESLELIAEGGQLLGEPPHFEAKRRLDLNVRVVDFAGAPLPGATCMLLDKAQHLSPQTGLRLFGPPGSLTDALGRARVTASDAGLHELLVILPARAFFLQPQVRVGGPELEVRVPRTGTLEIRGAREARLLDLPNGWWMTVRAGQNRYGLMETRGDSLLIHGLPGGSYRVEVEGQVRPVEVVPGQVSSIVDFTG